jgi:hypothetical protein
MVIRVTPPAALPRVPGMSTEDFIVDILLIVVIFRQLRAQPYTARTAILPMAVVVWAGFHYLAGFHVGGNDVWLIAFFTLIGLGLGLASAATTYMWRDGARVLGKVGLWACLTWIVGMGFRFAFALYANTDGGARAIGTFSRHHAITSSQVWTTALVLMAFAEVISRVVMLQARRIRLAGSAGPSTITLPDARRSPEDETAAVPQDH